LLAQHSQKLVKQHMETTLSLQERVLQALDEIRPFLVNDGGDVALESIENGVVSIRFVGACKGCTVNRMTLRSGVEMTVKKFAPEIQSVVNIDEKTL
jgi:Fe-S cluster biogenesis protein NfuA